MLIYFNNRTLRKERIQVGFCAFIFVYNAAYYIPVPLTRDQVINETNIIGCDFVSQQSAFYMGLFNFIYYIVILFGSMVILNGISILAIYASRIRVIQNLTAAENRTRRRDALYVITAISLNLIWLLINLPMCVIAFSTGWSGFTFLVVVYIFYSSYAVNFYVVLCSNSLFRREFLTMFKLKKPENLMDEVGSNTKKVNNTRT